MKKKNNNNKKHYKTYDKITRQAKWKNESFAMKVSGSRSDSKKAVLHIWLSDNSMSKLTGDDRASNLEGLYQIWQEISLDDKTWVGGSYKAKATSY